MYERAERVLRELRAAGLQLRPAGASIRVKPMKGQRLTDEQQGSIRANKLELLAELRSEVLWRALVDAGDELASLRWTTEADPRTLGIVLAEAELDTASNPRECLYARGCDVPATSCSPGECQDFRPAAVDLDAALAAVEAWKQAWLKVHR